MKELKDQRGDALSAPQVHGSKAFSQGFQELRAGGLRSMWQGNAVNVLKGTPQSTLQCLIYAQVRRSRGSTCGVWNIRSGFVLLSDERRCPPCR